MTFRKINKVFFLVIGGIGMSGIAEVLHNLGSERVWVVHGSDGTDELTITGPSDVVELRDGKLRRFEVTRCSVRPWARASLITS